MNGEEAKEVLRWLRLNATFLSKAGSFGSIGVPAEARSRLLVAG